MPTRCPPKRHMLASRPSRRCGSQTRSWSRRASHSPRRPNQTVRAPATKPHLRPSPQRPFVLDSEKCKVHESISDLQRCAFRRPARLLILASEHFSAKWPRSGKSSQRKRRRDKLNITFEVPRVTAATKADPVAINQTRHDGHRVQWVRERATLIGVGIRRSR